MALARPHSRGSACRQQSSGNFLVSPGLGLMIWTLVLFLFTMWVLSKVAFPKIQEALDKRAKTISDSIDAAERQRKEADELLEEYRGRLAEAREQADEIMARARKAAETASAEATAAGKERREELVAAGEARHRSRDAALAGADPQGGRRPHRAGDREGDPQVADRRRPEAAGRGRAQRGRLLGAVGVGELADARRSPGIRRGALRGRPGTGASSTRAARAARPVRRRARRPTASCRSSSSAPTSPRARRWRGCRRAVSGAEPELINFLELLIEKHRMPEIFRDPPPSSRSSGSRRTGGSTSPSPARSSSTPRWSAEIGEEIQRQTGQQVDLVSRSTRRSSAASCCRSATWSSTRASALAWRNFEKSVAEAA